MWERIESKTKHGSVQCYIGDGTAEAGQVETVVSGHQRTPWVPLFSVTTLALPQCPMAQCQCKTLVV